MAHWLPVADDGGGQALEKSLGRLRGELGCARSEVGQLGRAPRSRGPGGHRLRVRRVGGVKRVEEHAVWVRLLELIPEIKQTPGVKSRVLGCCMWCWAKVGQGACGIGCGK